MIFLIVPENTRPELSEDLFLFSWVVQDVVVGVSDVVLSRCF